MQTLAQVLMLLSLVCSEKMEAVGVFYPPLLHQQSLHWQSIFCLDFKNIFPPLASSLHHQQTANGVTREQARYVQCKFCIVETLWLQQSFQILL